MKSISILIVSLILAIYFNNTTKKPYDLFEVHEREIVLQNKISKITKIEIGLDTTGNSLWKRISETKLYDKEGFLIMEISPKYVSRPWPKSSPDGMTIDEMNYYSIISKTNIPNGEADTTHFGYDKNEKLISIKDEFLTTYKYDKYDSPIEKCVSSEYLETVCHIKRYEYDENERIISRVDSSGVMASRKGRKWNIPTKKIFYKYDNEGRITFEGEYERVFNDKGQLIEVKQFIEGNDSLGDKYIFAYNSEGKRVSEKYTRVISSSWNPETNVVSNIKTKTTYKYFYYNEKGLLKQEKILNENDKLTSLKNYEYAFY